MAVQISLLQKDFEVALQPVPTRITYHSSFRYTSTTYLLIHLLSLSMPSRTSDHPANALSALQDPTSAVNTILSGRKCWRILKGRNEPVWPPPLEAALIEGKLHW